MDKVKVTPGLYYDALVEEVIDNSLALANDHWLTLRRYYKAMIRHSEKRPFYRYNWQRRTVPMVELIQALPRRDTPWHILDAGCGVGTEVLLWATLRDDVVVTGVEINRERLDTAVARHQKYQATKGEALPVKFLMANVFDLLAAESFDLIWSMEAISHIDPAERFLRAAFNSLNSGGHLVISDSHLLNPAMLWRIFRLRRQGIKHSHKVLADGQRIPYAEERLFSVPVLTRLLRQNGFSHVQSQLSIFFPPFMARFENLFAGCLMLDRLLNRLPLVRQAGGIYTLTGTKL
jgi:2-polyprenyl-3-methyl-5-hydroxy-6-metoxy-1,4-benzoquinol methylase